MALTRKFLESMGIEGKQIESIIEAHSETVTALKAERDKAKEEAEAASAKLPDLQKKLEEAKADKTSLAELQSKYDEIGKQLETITNERDGIKSQFDAYKEEVRGREDLQAKQGAYRNLLRKAGVADKYLDSVLRVANLSEVELEDGEIKGAEDIEKELRETWSDFLVKKRTDKHDPDNPPNPNNGVEGANPIAVQIAKERHERMYGKSEE